MVDTGYCSRYAPNGAQCRQWHQGLLPSGAPQRPGLILLQPAPRAGGGMLTAKMVHEGTTPVLRWRPTSDLPKLPASLARVMKKPDILKHVAGEFMIWLLSHQGLQKPGDNGFIPRMAISCSSGTVCYHRQGPAFVQGPCEPGGDRFMEQHEEPEKSVSSWFPRSSVAKLRSQSVARFSPNCCRG